MDLFLSVHLQKQYISVNNFINKLTNTFKWTLRSLLRSLVIKSLIDNIFVERLGFCLCAPIFLTYFWQSRWCVWQIWLRKMRWLHDFVRRGKGVIILFLVLQNAFLMANFCNNFLVWIGTIMRNHYFLTFPACL